MKRVFRKKAIGILILLSISLVLGTARTGAQDERPLLDDVATLDLEVTNREVVDEISTGGFGNETSLVANEGYRLWVVTLEGTAPCTCALVFRSDEFSAIWQENNPDRGGTNYVIVHSRANNQLFGWSIPDQNAIATTTTYLTQDQPLSLQVAFILPESVEYFRVRVPSAVVDDTLPELGSAPTNAVTSATEVATEVAIEEATEVAIEEATEAAVATAEATAADAAGGEGVHVTSVERVNSFGPSDFLARARAGHTFVLVKVEVTGNVPLAGSEAMSYMDGQWALKDTNNNEYAVSALYQGKLVFEVPTNADGLALWLGSGVIAPLGN